MVPTMDIQDIAAIVEKDFLLLTVSVSYWVQYLENKAT
jgi:hypothetical protein